MRRGAARQALVMRKTAHPTASPLTDAGTAVRLLDTNEAAASLDIGRRTLQEHVAARRIAHIKIGRAIRFHPDDLADFVNRNRVKAAGWKGGAA